MARQADRSSSPSAQNSISACSKASRWRTRAWRVVQHAEARVDPGRERVRAQKAVAEAVDGRDPGGVELACELGAPGFDEPGANPVPQLSRRPLRVGDDQQRVDVEPALADRLDEALDEDGRLPRPRAGRDEDDARGLDGRGLLRVRQRSLPLHPAHRGEIAPRRAAGVAERVVADVAGPDPLRRSRAHARSRRSICPQNSSSSR